MLVHVVTEPDLVQPALASVVQPWHDVTVTKNEAMLIAGRAAVDGGTLQAARIAAGFRRQTDVAVVLDVSSQAVCRWEAGLRSPRRQHALRLGRLLGPHLEA